MTIVQEQKVSYDSEADSTTHSLTITEPVQDRLMVLVAAASAVLNTPSGWSLAISATNDPDIRIFYRVAPASFGTTVQFGSGSSCSASAVYLEYSGIVDTSPLDQTASNTSVAQTGTTGTTTQANELLIGALGAGGTNADANWSSWASSFTEEHDLASSGGSFNVSLGVASLVVSSTGTYGTSATNGAGSGPCGCIATFKAAPDAINKVADRGSAQNLTAESSTAVDMAAAGSITVGNYLVARLALDNAGGGGAAVTLGVTDPRSNTWTILGPANQDPGAANAGTTCYIAYAKVANGYTNGDDITFTYSGVNVTAKAIVVEEWTGIHATTPEAVAATTATGASTTPSISRTPTATGQLFYGALSIEGPSGDTYTQDADTTDGSWQTLTNLSTTSGTATNNQTVRGAAKFVTGTTAQTWDPTITSRDWAAVALVFAAAGTGTNVNAEAATGTGTANAPTTTVSTGSQASTGTGTANNPSPSVRASSGAAEGTGTANNASIQTTGGTNAQAGEAAATGTANSPALTASPVIGSAAATGTAPSPSPRVAPTAAATTATGTANDATVQTGSFTNAQAGVATGIGTANGTSHTVVLGAGVATGTGTANNAVAGASVTAQAGMAAATGTANGATVTVIKFANADVATGIGTVSAVSLTVLATTQAAEALGQAFNINTPEPDPNPLHASYREVSHRGTYREVSPRAYRDTVHAVYQEGS